MHELFSTQSRLLMTLRKRAFENIVGKKEKILVTSIFFYSQKTFENIVGDKGEILITSIFSFSHNVSTLSNTGILIFPAFNLSSANAFNLVQPRKLSFGKGSSCLLSELSSLVLTHYQTTNFRLFQTERVCRRQFQI